MLKDLPCGLILLYHRLGCPAHDPWDMFLDPAAFAAQMAVLADHWPVVSVSEGLRRVEQREAGHWVAVSFDDAYQEVVETALPRMRAGQRLTVFACTHEPEREFWWDRLPDPALQPALRHSADPRLETPDSGRSPRLSPAHLAELAQHHEVGNHTHRHLSLPVLSAEARLGEVRAARQLLQDWTGLSVPGLAYPFGDYADVGGECEWACTVRPGLVWKGVERRRLPRYWAPRLQGKEFLRWLNAQGLS